MTFPNGNRLTGLIIALLLSAWTGIIFLGLTKANAEGVDKQIAKTQEQINILMEVVTKLTLDGCLEKHDSEYCLDLWGHGHNEKPQ